MKHFAPLICHYKPLLLCFPRSCNEVATLAEPISYRRPSSAMYYGMNIKKKNLIKSSASRLSLKERIPKVIPLMLSILYGFDLLDRLVQESLRTSVAIFISSFLSNIGGHVACIYILNLLAREWTTVPRRLSFNVVTNIYKCTRGVSFDIWCKIPSVALYVKTNV